MMVQEVARELRAAKGLKHQQRVVVGPMVPGSLPFLDLFMEKYGNMMILDINGEYGGEVNKNWAQNHFPK